MAKIGQPAPAWKAQAVVNGEIKEISSDDYKCARRPRPRRCLPLGLGAIDVR